MNKMSFKIRGLDCAEEVAILRRELGPVIGEDGSLEFNLLKARITLNLESASPTEAEIIRIVAGTGMQAVPWEAHAAGSAQPESFRTRYGRAITTIVSALCLTLGFLVHAFEHDFLDALASTDAGVHEFPVASIVLYILAVISGGWSIFPKAMLAAKRLRPDINFLMLIAVIGAVAIGEWFEAGAVTMLFSVALLLESWSVGRARRAISGLMDLSPTTARYICPHHGDIEEKPVEDVPPGATVIVRPGEKIPLDGILTRGSTAVDQAPITGESIPVPKESGDELFAGTINGDGAIEFKVTRAADDSTLARIIQMVEDAQSRRAQSEKWVETFARYYTPAMMLLALLIAVVPPLILGSDWGTWVYQSLVILVIACPCALVISTPVSIVAGLSAAARVGVLIKGGVYLESPAGLKVIAMDKTGTLTRGQPVVQSIVPLNGHDEDEVLERAAALETQSEHPLARAVLRSASERNIQYTPADDLQIARGKGATGTIDGRRFWIGSHRLLHEQAAESEDIHRAAQELEDKGQSVIALGNDNHVCGLLGVVDAPRPESVQAVQELKDAGIEKVVMLTGDNEATARAIAEACGIDDYKAELLPEDKLDAIKSLVSEHGHVAMIGDGVNDAPALAAAGLGIAMGAAGTDAAIETADVALMNDDLSKVAWLIRHSRRTLTVIRQNVAFALGLKLVFIVLAVAGMATLWMAIAADMGASLIVIFNGLRLLRA